MRHYFTQVLSVCWMALFAVGIILFWAPAQAQQGPLTDAQIAALVGQFLPPQVSLAQASDDQLAAAITQALAVRPDAAAPIVAYLCRTFPAKALVIIYAAVSALPDAKDAIVDAAKSATPPEMHAAIETEAQRAYDQSTGGDEAGGAGDTSQIEWSSSDSRDDAPASPVKP